MTLLPPHPQRKSRSGGGTHACSEEGTAQEGKAVAILENQEPQAKGAEASAASKGETQKRQGPRPQSHPLPWGHSLGAQEWPCIGQR